MSYTFNCPNCDTCLEAEESLYGTKLNCPQCDTKLKIPTAEEIAAVQAEAEAPAAAASAPAASSGKPRLGARKSTAPAADPYQSVISPTAPEADVQRLVIPAHARAFVASLRKGSPCVPLIVCCLLLIPVYILFIVASARQNEKLIFMSMIAFLILYVPTLIFGSLYLFRSTALVNLGSRPSTLSPTLMVALCFVGCVSIVPGIIHIFVFPGAYVRMLEEQGLAEEAPPFKPLYSYLVIIPFVGMVFGIMNLIQWHKALKFFALKLQGETSTGRPGRSARGGARRR